MATTQRPVDMGAVLEAQGAPGRGRNHLGGQTGLEQTDRVPVLGEGPAEEGIVGLRQGRGPGRLGPGARGGVGLVKAHGIKLLAASCDHLKIVRGEVEPWTCAAARR